MKSRWQKSLEDAVAAYDTPMPWARGNMRQAMIARRAQQTQDNGPSLKIVASRA